MIDLPKPQKFVTRLVSAEKISETVYLELFELLEPTEITFLAGQTVMLYVAPASPAGGPEVNRSMSIASVPAEKHFITLIHDVSPMGAYARWTLSAKGGDRMDMMGPLGSFIVDRESHRNKVFVATGTGIAPVYAMVMEYLASGVTEDVTVCWACGMKRVYI